MEQCPETNDRINELKEKFINEVLTKLYSKDKKKIAEAYQSGSMISTGKDTFSIKPEYNSFLKASPIYKPKGTHFVHFTSLKALYGIIQSETLRMYNTSNMEDKLEGTFYGVKDKLTDELKGVKNNLHLFSLIEGDVLEKGSTNILNMWRLYGNNGSGCAIEFEIDYPFYRNVEDKIGFGKVQYESPDLTSFLEAKKKFEKENKLDKISIEPIVQYQVCLHKQPILSIENETRLFTTISSPPAPLINHPEFGFDTNYKNDVTSYYKLKLYNTESDYPTIRIKRIQFGYKISDENVKKHKKIIIGMLLANHQKQIKNLSKGDDEKLKQLKKIYEDPKIEKSPLDSNYG